MNTYRVFITEAVIHTIDVRAENGDDATEIAYDCFTGKVTNDPNVIGYHEDSNGTIDISWVLEEAN